MGAKSASLAGMGTFILIRNDKLHELIMSSGVKISSGTEIVFYIFMRRKGANYERRCKITENTQ
ncbi:hypothetical protein MASR2M66_27800 [Chloroflexota bacterium]